MAVFEDDPTCNQGEGSACGVLPTAWSAVPGLEVPDILGPAYNQAGGGFTQRLHARDDDRFLDMNAPARPAAFSRMSPACSEAAMHDRLPVSGWAQNSSGTPTPAQCPSQQAGR